MLINVEMPTIVGVLTFMSMIIMLINVEMPKFVGILTFMSMIISCSVELSIKMFYNLGPDFLANCILVYTCASLC